ncbi:TPA: Gfo/Idh/MocA family oxidoreductase [bacterium]|nr:Gfo/Idh/MocA family oxidoreductase [bacterium]
MDQIRVGIIGSGGIFRGLHVPYYEMSKRAKIVAVADIKEESAKSVAEKFGADAYTDYRQLLDRKDIDAVDVCVHPRPHRDIAVYAAQAGKHILMEKPMCRNVAEADEMISAADKAGVMLQIAYMLPFNPNFIKLKELLSNGTLGDVTMAYCNQVGWFGPGHPWLFIKEESGGMLVEQAIHNFDVWLWLYGAVDSVYAKTSHVPLGGTYPEKPKAVENNAVLVINFKSGGVGMFIKSWAAEIGHGGEGVVCTNGSASFSEGGLRWKTHDMKEAENFKAEVPDDDTYRTLSPEARERNYWSYASKGASIDHWLKCIAGEEKPTTSGRVGRAGIEIAEAAYLSSEKGLPVTLPI